MGFTAFLDQLHWYELIGGIIATIILAWVSVYAFGFSMFMILWGLWASAIFRVAAFVGVVGGAGWFIYHLIQKYGG